MRSDPHPSLRGFVAGFVVAMAALPAVPVWAESSAEVQAPACQCVCDEDTGVIDNGDEIAAPAADTGEVAGDQASPVATEDVTSSESSAETAWPQLVISEFLPDPVGSDADGEFIEIRNIGPNDASLNGWRFFIGTKSYDLPEETLGAGGYRYFLHVETGLQLTNSGLTLQLLAPEGTAVSVASFSGTAKTGQSWARDESGIWSWTTPTPGAPNIFEEPVNGADTASVSVTETIVTSDIGQAIDTTAADQTSATSDAQVETPAGSQLSTSGFQLYINELLPDPVGSDDQEWIELANGGEQAVSLAGWTIDDDPGGSKPYVLKEGQVVPAQGFLILPKALTGLSLNNDGDSVRLFRPDGTLADSAEYREKAKEGKSRAKLAAGWGWAVPTPGAANAANELAQLPSAAAASVDGEDAGAAPEPPDLTEWSDLPELDEGEEVAVSGVVSLPFGILSKTLFTMQDEAGSAGLIVRYYGSARPALAVGDVVIVSGRLSDGSSGRRLGVPADGLSVVGLSVAAAMARELVDLGFDDSGLTVDVSGDVTATGKGWLKVSDPGGEAEVKLVLPAGAAVSAAAGDTVGARGVVRFRNGAAEIILADRKDLKITLKPAASAAEPAAAKLPDLVPAQKSASRRWLPLLFLIPAAGLTVVWQVQRRRAMQVADN